MEIQASVPRPDLGSRNSWYLIKKEKESSSVFQYESALGKTQQNRRQEHFFFNIRVPNSTGRGSDGAQTLPECSGSCNCDRVVLCSCPFSRIRSTRPSGFCEPGSCKFIAAPSSRGVVSMHDCCSHPMSWMVGQFLHSTEGNISTLIPDICRPTLNWLSKLGRGSM